MREEAFQAALLQHRVGFHAAALLQRMWQKDSSALRRPTNGCVDHWFSEKTGRRMALSGHHDLAAVAECFERDPTILAWWPQPFEYGWVSQNLDGKATGRSRHDPDYVVLRESGFVVMDFASDSDLRKRQKKGKGLIQNPATHDWSWPDAERAYAALGLRYEIRSTAEIPYVLLDNIKDLERYKDGVCPPLTEDARRTILDVFDAQGFMSVRECVDKFQIDGNVIRRAVVEGLIVADLIHERIGTPDVMIYRDRELLADWRAAQEPLQPLPLPGDGIVEVGDFVKYHGYTYVVQFVDEHEVLLQGAGDIALMVSREELADLKANGAGRDYHDGPAHQQMRAAYVDLSHKERERGIARLSYLEGPNAKKLAPVNVRTKQRWAKIAASVSTRLWKIVALGKSKHVGNRAPRFTEAHEAFFASIVREVHDGTPSATKTATYKVYLDRNPKAVVGEDPMSFAAASERIDRASSPVDKHGRRGAYHLRNLTGRMEVRRSPHGVLPHEVCHIDHTLCDVFVVAEDDTQLGRPWLTLIWDASVRRCRAMYLSFRAPNTSSCLMAIREYVKRWDCLAKTFVVDGGFDLHTESVAAMEEAFGITIRKRKGSDPRSGSPIESQNRAREQQVDKQMHGNTSHLKAARRYAGRKLPRDDAEWTLPALYLAYQDYFFELRAKHQKHVKTGRTPEQYENELRRYCGSRDFLPVSYDFDLVMLTAPIFHSATRTVEPQGVFVDGQYFTSAAIANTKAGSKLPVRVEPHCANLIYVKTTNGWRAAFARNLQPYRKWTWHEAAIAYSQWKKLATSASRKSKTNEYACYLQERMLHPENFDARLLALECQEEQALLDHLGLNIDVEGKNVRIGVVKPLSSSRGRPLYAGANRLPSRSQAAADTTSSSVLQPGSFANTAAEEQPDDTGRTTSNADTMPPRSESPTKSVSAGRPRRKTRLVSDDAWKRSGFL
ncbi:hypothetical protein [Cupriavidus lacunae]|uniref:Integrase catalytic domain-containing protein n=1 Tax=Cupriavidus lacunae TaxID=2666307 RepID=A0A370MYC4_9BURK|nr:hypothetical protein [Cupriavidus lacunae]RDJ98349.1 hypothetical protein DN412_41135 [Cupriavidus lacunae]